MSRPLASGLFAGLLVVALSACSTSTNIPGETLEREQENHLRELFELEAQEAIITLNNLPSAVSNGSFYTDQRVAGYWISENQSGNNLVSVRYEDVKSMTLSDLSGSRGQASFILITKKNGRSVQIFVDGKSKEVGDFYDGVQRSWMGAQ